MTKPNKRNPAQSALGAKARKLESLLAGHGLQLPHMKAMDLLSALDGHRTRHGDASARKSAEQGPVATEAFQAARATYASDRDGVDGTHPELGDKLATLFGMPERTAAKTSMNPLLLGGKVNAEVHTDDRNLSAVFDARIFLAQATPKALADLIGCDWRGDYPADRVAEFQAERMHDANVSLVLNYAIAVPDMGFECSVDGRQAMAWLEQHRRDVLVEALSIAYRDDDGELDWRHPDMVEEIARLRRTQAEAAARLKGDASHERVRRNATARLLPFITDDRVTTILNRFGEVCNAEEAAKIGEGDMARYVDSLVDECCFLVKRNGETGLLLELEYMSLDGEDDDEHVRRCWPAGFEPDEANVATLLRTRYGFLAKECPWGRFYVTGHRSDVVMGRCALRVFVPGDAVEPHRMEALSERMSTVVDIHRSAKQMAGSDNLAERLGFVVLDHGEGYVWTHPASDDEAANTSNRTFGTETAAWAEAERTVTANVMGNDGISRARWDTMTMDERVEIGRTIY